MKKIPKQDLMTFLLDYLTIYLISNLIYYNTKDINIYTQNI